MNKAFSSTHPDILVSGLVSAGEYQFQLVVTDQAGNSSQAAIVSIIIEPPLTFWHKLQSWIAKTLRLLNLRLKRN
ncbi:hypothetical protein [uncultured Paraglaciecola sp.]|uniref:hypothetical protein n=1 Tax=uncultured Paraglaciecola sp. TaxID=1765024 RepID=UPI0030DA26F2